MEIKRKTPALKSLDNALEILDFIGETPRAMTASEIAKGVDASISSVYKMLNTFVEREYLDFDRSTKFYRLNTKILRFANTMRNERSVILVALPVMLALAEKTRETVHLGIPEGYHGVFIEKVNSPHTVGVQTRIGTRVPFNRGATSKAMMAYLSAERFEDFCTHYLDDGTAEGKAAMDDAIVQRASIRRNGYVVTREEVNQDVAAVAAPILEFGDRLVGSMAIAGPCDRFSDAKVDSYIQLIQEACKSISRSLGASY